MIPLNGAEGQTFHKGQGITIGKTEVAEIVMGIRPSHDMPGVDS